MGWMSKIFLLVVVSYLEFNGTKTSRRIMSGNLTSPVVLSLITPSMRSTPSSKETSSFLSIIVTSTQRTTSAEQPTRRKTLSNLLLSMKDQGEMSSTNSISTSPPVIGFPTVVNDKPSITSEAREFQAAVSENSTTSTSIFPSDPSFFDKDLSDVFPMENTSTVPLSSYSNISGTNKSVPEQNETLSVDHSSGIQPMTPPACSSSECLLTDPSSETTPANIAPPQRRFMCERYTDIPVQECYEQINQTDSFVCLNTISSCEGVCGRILNSCSCDMHCELYNVCCDDFKEVCPMLWSEAEKTLGNLISADIECVGASVKYLVIAGCSANDYSEEDKDKCLHGDVMITSAGSLHFKNVFCMRCNRVDEAESIKWDFFLRVSLGRDLSDMFFSSLDPSIKESILSQSVAEWGDSEKMARTSRVCSNGIINECPPGAGAWIKDKCLSQKADVSVETKRGSNIYKNIHCAACNVDADYYCRGTNRRDYEENQRQRFSTLINVTLDKKTDNFVLEASAPFRWRRAVCSGFLADLNCKVTKCFTDVPPSNNACVMQRIINCVLLKFSLINEPILESNCLSNFTCITELFNSLLATILRTGPGMRDDIKSVSNMRDYDKPNLSFKAHLLFTVWSEHFPFSLDYIYEAYRLITNNLLHDQGFRGKFTLCFVVFEDTGTCKDVECKPRTYTIHSPTSSPVIRDAEKSLGCLIQSGVYRLYCPVFVVFLILINVLF